MDTATETSEFRVDIYLNDTTVSQAAARGDADAIADMPRRADSLVIFTRFGDGPRTRPGDTLTLVHTAVIDAEGSSQAREFAFGIGNGQGEGGDSEAYYAHGARSVSVGDVIVVHTPDGPGASICDPYGWTDVDLRDFKTEEG